VTKITLDGREVDVDPKKPLIHACHEAGVDVPMYCYHPGLTPVGSCRICQVEVKMGETPPRVVVACRTPIVEGMVVNCEAPKAHDARRECLEFLLKNHPLDCPICDKAGECDLQDYSFMEGQGEGRTNEPRRKLEKRKSLGDVIVLDEERCILCSRCVRFMEEVPKSPQLTVAGLGSRSVITTFMDRPLSGNYQGNLADICPVGALTLKPFRFQARVWNLTKSLSTCAECSRGCSITVEVLRGGEVKRFRPRYNQDVNGYWMCDTGRFAFEHTGAEHRLEGACILGYSGFEPAEVEDALARASDMLATHGDSLLVASPFMTVEEAAAAKQLADELGARTLFVSPAPNDLADDLLHTGDPCPNRRGLEQAGFEAAAPDAAIAAIAASGIAILCGERVAELLGREALAALPADKRLIAFDAQALDVPASDVCIGIPIHVEKTGTWINVDGHAGRLAVARRAPAGVEPLTRSLDRLRELARGRGVGSA
jgi:NADH-quinone oxidoreductase subunit G